ncbi:CBS domain-containing protein [Noviherbaspirillum massiliense]|uniref:CBS domain-containing protein n=1 Tax=Noviherbaspirillum massiliense TaxID=1465823 RepID=UPI003899174A
MPALNTLLPQPVSSIMEKNVCAVRMDDTAEQVEHIRERNRISSVPAVKGKDTVLGIITSRPRQFPCTVQGPDGSAGMADPHL